MDEKKYQSKYIDFDTINRNATAWYEFFAHNIYRANESMRFQKGEQWDASRRVYLANTGLDPVVHNKISDISNKIKGKFRDVKPEIYVNSADYTDKDDAEKLMQKQQVVDTYEGYLRYIQYSSNAINEYYSAFDNAYDKGYAAIEICDDYASTDSFDIMPYIKNVKIPEHAFFSPHSTNDGRDDGDFCGVIRYQSRTEFETEYPDIPYPRGFPAAMRWSGETAFTWGNNKSIGVCTYYYKRFFKKNLHRVQIKAEDGSVIVKNMDDKDYQEMTRIAQIAKIDRPVIIQSREVNDWEIRCAKCIYGKILEDKPIAGKELRVIFMAPASYWQHGKFYVRPYTQDAEDAQRTLNYVATNIIAFLKKSHRERILATPQHTEGFEDQYRNPDRVNGALYYNPDLSGGPVTPQIINAYNVPASLTQQYEQLTKAISHILGAFDAFSNEMADNSSGVAVQTRILEGNSNIKIYRDALLQGITLSGRCIVSMMKERFNGEKTLPIRRLNGEIDSVIINRLNEEQAKIDNPINEYNVNIEVKIGDGYEYEQQKQFQQMTQLLQAAPFIAPHVIDIYGSKLNLPENAQLLARLKNLLPAASKAIADGEDPNSVPPQNDPNQQLMQEKMKLEQEKLLIEKEKAANQRLKIQMDALSDAQKADIDEQQIMADVYETNSRASAEIKKAMLEHDATLKEHSANIIDAILSSAPENNPSIDGNFFI